MSGSTCVSCGGGLDAEQLRLILADVNTSHRALVEELSRRIQEAEQARNNLQAKLDHLTVTFDEIKLSKAVDAEPEVIKAREEARKAREKEFADLKTKVGEYEKQVATLTLEKTNLFNEKRELTEQLELLKEYVERLEKAIREASWCRKPEMPPKPTKKRPTAAP